MCRDNIIHHDRAFVKYYFLNHKRSEVELNSVCCTDIHPPKMIRDVIGIGGYDRDKRSTVVCMHANDDNNFLNEGIVRNSVVFVDTSADFTAGALNVFKTGGEVPFKLSKTEISGAEYVGKIFLTVNQYEV